MKPVDFDEASMPFLSHLAELRTRLIYALSALVIIFLSLLYFAQDIYTFVANPVLAVLPQGTDMIATQITSTFFAPLKLTFFVALALTMPVILHQAWSFISPGLYQHEKKLAIPILVSSVILFYGGIAFAYGIALPMLMGFFSAVGPEGVAFMPDIQHYLTMVIKLFFGFGLAFEIPVALMVLIASGVVSIETVRSKRGYVVIGCFIAGMLLTPPDILSQTLLAVPMLLLFEAGLLLATWLKLDRTREENL